MREMRQLVFDSVHSDDFLRGTFGGAVRGSGPSPWVRVVVRPVELRGERHWQFSYFDGKRSLVKNVLAHELDPLLDELLAVGFAGVHLSMRTEEIDLQLTKKGKLIVGRKKVAAATQPQPHNRIKDVPLPEGRSDRLLEALGILTRDGQVKPSRRAKYTQINEFLKHLTHILSDAGLNDLGRPLSILDCGCGLSYLTLAVHHYLNDILAIPAHIIGVDVNEELIRKSAERSQHLGMDDVSFSCARIEAVEARPDIVLALHACDTATDEALSHAVAAEARIVLSVPCCHHHLNDQLQARGETEVLRPLLRHGILQQRTADLVTDAFRALALRIMGYRTDVVEFVSPVHTARNLMIRAVRGLPVGDSAFVQEYVALRRFWGVAPFIETALGESFKQLLVDAPSPEASAHTVSRIPDR